MYIYTSILFNGFDFYRILPPYKNVGTFFKEVFKDIKTINTWDIIDF